MNQRTLLPQLLALLLLLMAGRAPAMIDGVRATNFNFVARSGHISTPDGNYIYFWGFANGAAGTVQYPGPTMIVPQGATVTVTLTNELTVPVSIIFPGQARVQAVSVSGANANGILTLEAAPGGTVRYSFVASRPGTYLYQSGTRPDLQVEMGLLGALIVEPTGSTMMMPMAYEHMDTRYDVDCLFLLTEMDPRIHEQVEQGLWAQVDTTNYFPVAWFINGRCAPDTMDEAFVPWLPTQPYNCMPMMESGQRLLMRVIGAGRDMHPFHYHGNHAKVIARDGRLLASGPSTGPDLGPTLFTIQATPGETVDAIFTWTGQGLGWDIYGHHPGDPMAAHESPEDHGKPFPVALPDPKNLTNGAMYSGSPFLGAMGSLPPGEGGMNPTGGFMYMWHSHTEKEMTNYDIFPGGMMTMLLINPPGTTPMPMGAPAAGAPRR